MSDFDELSIARMKRDSEHKEAVLELALEEYDEDGEIVYLLAALRKVAEAQGGLGKLARRMKVKKVDLEKRFNSRARLDRNELAKILHGLGYQHTVKPMQAA